MTHVCEESHSHIVHLMYTYINKIYSNWRWDEKARTKERKSYTHWTFWRRSISNQSFSLFRYFSLSLSLSRIHCKDNFITFLAIFHDTFDRVSFNSLLLVYLWVFILLGVVLCSSYSIIVCVCVCSRLYTPNFRKFLEPNRFSLYISFPQLTAPNFCLMPSILFEYLFSRLRFFSLRFELQSNRIEYIYADRMMLVCVCE